MMVLPPNSQTDSRSQRIPEPDAIYTVHFRSTRQSPSSRSRRSTRHCPRCINRLARDPNVQSPRGAEETCTHLKLRSLMLVYCYYFTQSDDCGGVIVCLSYNLCSYRHRIIPSACLSGPQCYTCSCYPRGQKFGYSHRIRKTNPGGSIPLVVVVAILSGIIGVLVGQEILKLLRIPAGMKNRYLIITDDR